MLEQDLTSLEKKVGQLFFIGISGPEIDEPTAALLDDISPGGVCLFGRNIRTREQTRTLLEDLWSSLARPFLSVDQEGGLVDRLKRILPAMPAASKLTSKDQAAEEARLMGKAMQLLGFNMDFAPVVDVMNTERGKAGNGIYSRTYGADADSAAEFAESFIDSLSEAGILSCIKHFPGLGASQLDSHEDLPHVDLDETELSFVDLVPYRRLIAVADSVMVAHAAFPRHRLQERDDQQRMLPSSLSHNFVTRLLRDELGFQGLVVTDDLEMGAIMRNYGIGDAAKMALTAGCDMLAVCADPQNVRQAFHSVIGAVESGEISLERIDASLARIATAKDKLRKPAAFDGERLEALASDMAEFAARI